MSVDVAERPADMVDLRCPEPWKVRCSAGRLLAKLQLDGQRPSFVHPDNLIELECQDCKVRMRKDGRQVVRVLHRYDFLGSHVETLVIDDELARYWFPCARYQECGCALCRGVLGSGDRHGGGDGVAVPDVLPAARPVRSRCPAHVRARAGLDEMFRELGPAHPERLPAPGVQATARRARPPGEGVTMESQDWRRRAACRGKDPDLWFPVSDSPPPGRALRDLQTALDVCKTCPVKWECLAFAVATSQAHGIWGGMTAKTRRHSRRCRDMRAALFAS